MVVGGEQGLGPQELFVRAVLQHRPGDGHAVKSGGAPADLVQDEQGVLRGVAQDVRHLRHLHHEGGLAGAEVVAGADAGENAVHHADAGAGRRHERAHLGHEDDEGHLAHIGGFARHVGAGDDGHPLLLLPHKRVVGNKEAVFQNLLHHRMAAVPDLDDAGFVHIRPAVAVPHGHGGKGRQGVRLRHGGGRPLDALRGGGDLLPQLGEQLVFQRHHPVRGGEDGVLQILELLGDVPLAVHQGLLADVRIRHLVGKGLGYLDVVAEHLVVADLQRPDAGALLLLGLHLGDDALAALEDVTQAVYLLIIAVPDEAALPDGEGGLVADDGGDAAADVVQGVQLAPQLRQASGGEAVQLGGHLRQLFDGGAEGGHVPAAGGAVDNASDEPLHIPQARHGGDELLPGDGVVHQGRHGGIALADGGDAQQRPLQPGPQAPGAHGRLRPIQHPQEASFLLLAPQGLRQLQVPPGRQVQLHEAAFLVVIQVVDVGEIRFLGLVQVMQQPAQGHGRRRDTGGEAGKGLVPELAADVLFRLIQQKAALSAVFHPAAEFFRQSVRQGLLRIGPVA